MANDYGNFKVVFTRLDLPGVFLSRRRLILLDNAVWYECAQMRCWRRQDLRFPEPTHAALNAHLALCTQDGPMIWGFERSIFVSPGYLDRNDLNVEVHERQALRMM